jgi:hypothetical protein
MASSTRQPYKYLPITDNNGIRLIALQPWPDKAAPVHCSMIHTTLRQARDDIYEHYTALSYVWGDANDKTPISIDGKFLQITKNLECALRHLRDEKRVLHVWADGVCINQQDDDEKSQQVQQMGRVYEVAHHTVIFLGECDPAEEAVLINILSCYRKGILYPEGIEGIRVLKRVLARPWFYRIWVLQELVMSHDPRLQIGNIRFPWWNLSHLKTLFPNNEDSDDIGPSYVVKEVLGELSASLQGGFEVVSQMNNIKWIFERSRVKSRCGIEDSPIGGPARWEAEVPTLIEEHGINKLLSILQARRGFQASDPKDRVFAHLGLVDDIDLRVDYRMTCAELFQTFAQRHISETNSYEIFAHVEDVDLQQRMKGLPSWAPDWTYREENPRRQILKYLLFELGGKSESGYKPVLNAQSVWTYFSHNISDFYSGVFSLRVLLLNSISKLSQVLDTTTYKRSSDYHDRHHHACAWIANQLGVDTARIIKKSITDPGNSIRRVHFLVQELNEPGPSILDGRRLAILEEERIAVVPASSQVDDLVYFLEKSTVPLVLRRADTEHQREQDKRRFVNLIGPCLVEDFMNIENVRLVTSFLIAGDSRTELVAIY